MVKALIGIVLFFLDGVGCQWQLKIGHQAAHCCLFNDTIWLGNRQVSLILILDNCTLWLPSSSRDKVTIFLKSQNKTPIPPALLSSSLCCLWALLSIEHTGECCVNVCGTAMKRSHCLHLSWVSWKGQKHSFDQTDRMPEKGVENAAVPAKTGLWIS